MKDLVETYADKLSIISKAWYLVICGSIFGYPKHIEEIRIARLAECADCPDRKCFRCGLCGCPLTGLSVAEGEPKTLCKANKWNNIAHI